MGLCGYVLYPNHTKLMRSYSSPSPHLHLNPLFPPPTTLPFSIFLFLTFLPIHPQITTHSLTSPSSHPHSPIRLHSLMLFSSLTNSPFTHQFTIHPPIHHSPTNTPFTHQFPIHPPIHHLPTNSPFTHQFTIHPPIHHSPINSPFTHQFTIHPPIHHSPTNSPFIHQFTIHPPIHHLPTNSPFTHQFTIHPPIHHSSTNSPFTHQFTIYPPIHHSPTNSPFTHQFTIYPPIHHSPTNSPLTHQFTIHPPIHHSPTNSPPPGWNELLISTMAFYSVSTLDEGVMTFVPGLKLSLDMAPEVGMADIFNRWGGRGGLWRMKGRG